MPALGQSLLAHVRQRAVPTSAALAVAGALGLFTASQAKAQLRAAESDQGSPARARYEALRAYHEGRYADALTAAATLPPDPDVLLLRGRAAEATGDYTVALTAFESAATRRPGSEAAFELGQLHLMLGHVTEGRRWLEPVITSGARSDMGEVIGRAARAAQQLGRYEQATTLFRNATALAGDNPELQTAWGDLFLEKENLPEAVKSYRAALVGDRRNPGALVGLARALAEENGQSARDLIARALTVNPNYVAAHLALADLALDEDRRDEAAGAVKSALAVNPSSLQALSLQAAMAFLDDRTGDFDALVARVLAINAHFGDVYRLAAAQAARHYRFEDAVALNRKALTIDPGNVRAAADLGTDLLRTGDETSARALLDRVFKADPYDVVAYNLLGLLDTLEAFQTSQSELVTLRLHPDEAPVIGEHALPLADHALTTLAAKYHTTVRGPILIEVFPRHDDFAVRNVGLPGMIGALGACFGRVVTLDSPRARPPGSFAWQAALWHELAHVITLQLSGNRIPRWLTEGISVYEEKVARPDWGRNAELEFADLLARDSVIPLASLNRGFMDPSTISIAYYEASLLVEYMVATHGQPSLEALVRAFADGTETDAALQRTMGTTMAGLEPGFLTWLHGRFDPIVAARTPPDDVVLAPRMPLDELEKLGREYPGYFDLQMRLGEARATAGDAAGAYAAWTRAATVLPVATGEEGPRERIAKLALSRGDAAPAIEALEGIVAHDGANVEAARQLAHLLDAAGDRTRSVAAWTRVAELDPFDATASAVLGRQALDARDGPNATRWFRAALAAGPADRAAAHCDLAEGYLSVGNSTLAKRQVMAALEEAPTYARAQDLLLEIVDGSR
jgi:cellulose synthase operon protein C